MNFWDTVGGLAQRLLNSRNAKPVDLSKIDRAITPRRPPQALPTRKRPQEAPLESVEALPEYTFVLESIRAGANAIFVTGKAGTGKSTLVRYLTGKLEQVAIVTPTALAAVNVGGSTIHSLFNIPPRTVNPDEVFAPRSSLRPVIDALGLLVVDEVSMVTPNLVDVMNNCLREARRSDKPFGGVPVVFVGDLHQLPPVVRDGEESRFFRHRYRTPYFFSADVFRTTPILPVELTRVFRQRDERFVNLLDRIRTNTNHRESVAEINRTCYRRSGVDDRGVTLVPTNAAALAINKARLEQLPNEPTVFEAIVSGEFDPKKDRFSAPYRLELKVGAQVLLVKNNLPEWLNGTTGTVIAIEQQGLRVELANGSTVTVPRARWEKIRYFYDQEERRISKTVVGEFQQFPVTLGWAITIHKSQGMTMDSVSIDLGSGAFATGQTYVALSRCRSLDGIILKRPIAMGDVKTDPEITRFYELLQPLRDGSTASS